MIRIGLLLLFVLGLGSAAAGPVKPPTDEEIRIDRAENQAYRLFGRYAEEARATPYVALISVYGGYQFMEACHKLKLIKDRDMVDVKKATFAKEAHLERLLQKRGRTNIGATERTAWNLGAKLLERFHPSADDLRVSKHVCEWVLVHARSNEFDNGPDTDDSGEAE
ncbi:MAG: hypothetical protein EPO23_06500 [Xanthobacteraceae bacterium]|nr:MAG: hypothetical protein EPO23_06500 [Xanthobacteraceae bacterium]